MTGRWLRILCLNTERGWRGGELQLELLQRGLHEHPQARIRMDIACRANEVLSQRLARMGAPVIPLPVSSVCDPRAILHLRRLVTTGGYDLVHAQASQAHSLARLALTGLHVPLVVSRRVDFPVSGGAKYRRGVAAYVAVSTAIRRILAEGGVDPRRVLVIRDGVDPARSCGGDAGCIRREFSLQADDPVVLCLAALVDHKGHRFLIEAWRQVEAACPRAMLLLAGSGPNEGALREQAQGLTRIRFLGQRADVADLLAAATVFCLPSVEEGLGSSILDAQFAGVPVLATTAGGIPELVEPECTGLLVAPGQPGPLATGLSRLLTDAGLRRRLALAGQTLASECFHYRRMSEHHRRLYRILVRS